MAKISKGDSKSSNQSKTSGSRKIWISVGAAAMVLVIAVPFFWMSRMGSGNDGPPLTFPVDTSITNTVTVPDSTNTDSTTNK